MHGTMALQPGHTLERLGLDTDPKVALTALLVSRMPAVLLAVVMHFQMGRLKARLQACADFLSK